MKDVVQYSRDRSNPVIKFKTPEQLLETIDYSLSKEGTGNEKLLELCEKVVEHSQKTGKLLIIIHIVNVIFPLTFKYST